MELKQEQCLITAVDSKLLIVPYGIETNGIP